MEKQLVLFTIDGCPYGARVEKELAKRKIKYKRIEVPSEHSKRIMLREISGQTSVPVLVEVIGSKNQDDDILGWLNENY